MSGRYEVHNRYSAYIEARRNYLEQQSESEEDVEIRTILRRPQHNYYRRSVSTSSEEKSPQLNISSPPSTTTTMVLIPTVTIQEAPKEVEIPIEASVSSVVQDIQVETPKEIEKSIENQPIEPICSVFSKIEQNVKPIVDGIKWKYNQTIEKLPEIYSTVCNEFLTYAPSVAIGFAVFLFFITFVSILKLVKYGAHSEPSFFCKYFSAPFAPLFDALCAPEPFIFADELPRVMGGLVDEMLLTLSEFFNTIAKGFSVFGTLFTAICNGLSQNVFFGFHELGENLGENISHLFHFVIQFFHQIIYFFLSLIASIAGAVAGVFTSLHDYLEPPKAVW